jgi:hypothetical protein
MISLAFVHRVKSRTDPLSLTQIFTTLTRVDGVCNQMAKASSDTGLRDVFAVVDVAVSLRSFINLALRSQGWGLHRELNVSSNEQVCP